MKTIGTDRLILRAWTMEDASAMFAYAKSPLVGPAAGWQPHKSLEDTREYLETAIREDETWAVTLKPDGRVIGSIGLHLKETDGVRELGYVMDPEFWGNGYMTEAAKAVIGFGFTELGLDAIVIFHRVNNRRSRRVIQKCGFRYDGTLRCLSRDPDGSLVDRCAYSMKRAEWEKGLSESRFCGFVQNRACEYFPCHKTDDPDHFNCLFCYCPMYGMKNCGDNPKYLENGIKDCSECTVPHFHYSRILAKLTENNHP